MLFGCSCIVFLLSGGACSLKVSTLKGGSLEDPSIFTLMSLRMTLVRETLTGISLRLQWQYLGVHYFGVILFHCKCSSGLTIVFLGVHFKMLCSVKILEILI